MAVVKERNNCKGNAGRGFWKGQGDIPWTTRSGLRSVGERRFTLKIFWAFQSIRCRLQGSTTCNNKTRPLSQVHKTRDGQLNTSGQPPQRARAMRRLDRNSVGSINCRRENHFGVCSTTPLGPLQAVREEGTAPPRFLLSTRKRRPSTVQREVAQKLSSWERGRKGCKQKGRKRHRERASASQQRIL